MIIRTRKVFRCERENGREMVRGRNTDGRYRKEKGKISRKEEGKEDSEGGNIGRRKEK